MKNWFWLITLVAGFLGIVAGAIWNLATWPVDNRLSVEVRDPSRGSGAPSPGTVSGPSSPNLDPLFAALAIHRPAEPTDAPDFTLPDMEGRPVRLREFRGKVMFINFWATWCPPCRLEMPSMERLYQTFQRTDFALLAVSIDRQGADVVKPFMEELKLTFPALLDTNTEVARQYGLRGLPTTYLVDRDGRLIGAAVGGRDWHSTEAKALIAGLLLHGSAAPGAPAQAEGGEGR